MALHDDETAAATIDPAEAGGVAAPAVADAAVQSGAEAPDTETQAEPKSLLDAALKALGQAPGEAGTATDAAPTADEEPAQPPIGASAPADQGETPADLALIPEAEFRALPKTTKTAIVNLRKEVNSLRPQAEIGAKVGQFMQEAGLTADEFAQGQDVMALMKRDPAAALREMEKHVTNLRSHLGLDLPADLAREVDEGYISEERAKELSQAQARAAHAERVQVETTQASAERAVLGDVASWEAATRQADADFDRKLPVVMEKAKLAALELGRPVRSGAEAVQIVRKAYEATNAMMRSFAPAPSATRPTPTSAASAPAKPSAPRTIYEAAAQAVRRA